MNRMLVVVFASQAEAYAGVRVLRQFDAEGSLALYALGVIAKSPSGEVTVLDNETPGAVGTGMGLAVGGLIGMLAGPVGMAVGAVAGTLVGAMRDSWVAGVGLDFVEETQTYLQPGRVAIVAEVEEDWIIPVDTAMEAAGGVVFRRARSDVEAAAREHELAILRTEIADLQREFTQAGESARGRLQKRVDAATARLETAMQQARQAIADLQAEADTRVQALESKWAQAQGALKATLQDRATRVRNAYDNRSAKLSKAWGLTKDALRD